METETQPNIIHQNNTLPFVDVAKWDSDEQLAQTSSNKWAQENTRARIEEELAQKALLLRKKELRWKLMRANEAKNRGNLDGIRTEVNFHKQKLSKATELAARLRAKYLRVVKSARLAEAQYDKAQAQLLLQEKIVADEKLMSTKLAIDCLNLGRAIYGDDYRLPNNNNSSGQTQPSIRREGPIQETDGPNSGTIKQSIVTDKSLLDQVAPFLRVARNNANLPKPPAFASSHPVAGSPSKRRKKVHLTSLSSLYDLKNSPLINLASYRLTSKFSELGLPLTDLKYSHNISPHSYICLPDMIGQCSDKSCPYQHKSNYMMTDLEKITDILSYKPEFAGFKPDPDLSDEENFKICRIKLKQKAARLISMNPDKTTEVIVQSLVRKIRGNDSDLDLLIKSRELPKVSHLIDGRDSRRLNKQECSCRATAIELPRDEPVGIEVKIKLEPLDVAMDTN